MLFLQATRPWEEGGKRRIALALLIGISPSSACARHLLVQRHLHESGGIWLCLFLPVPPGLLSSPSTKKGQFQAVVTPLARGAADKKGARHPCG